MKKKSSSFHYPKKNKSTYWTGFWIPLMIVERNERDCFVFEPEEPGIVDHPPTFLITRVSKGKLCEGAIEKQYINKLKR